MYAIKDDVTYSVFLRRTGILNIFILHFTQLSFVCCAYNLRLEQFIEGFL